MGRRLGRKRLYSLDKKGQSFSGSVGVGATGSLVQYTSHRDGQMIITDIVVDLGSSKGAWSMPGTKRLVLGHSSSAAGADTSQPSHLGLVDNKQNGVVTLVELTCLQQPAGGDRRLELQYASAATKDYSGSAGTHLMSPGNLTIGSSSQVEVDNNALDGNYLYLGRALATNGSTAAAYTAGKIHIRLHGHAVPDDK